MARPKKDAAAPPKKRGRPPKNKAAEAPKVEAQPPRSPASANAEVVKILPKDLERLVKSVLSRAAEQKSIGMTAKELIDKAAETKGLDKPAFGMVRKLYKMGKDHPEKLAVTLPHLLSYIDDLNLAEIADNNSGLPLDNPNEGQVDLEAAIAEQPPRTGLSIVRGDAAPDDGFEVPPAPDEAAA